VGNKTKEVAIGVAMLGRVFHNNPIPAEYAKVLVREITDIAMDWQSGDSDNNGCDNEKRLGFINPTKINQLKLNPVINEKK
jgi:hypothetical protein